MFGRKNLEDNMTKKELSSNGYKTDNDVFVIAEIGINHGGSMNKAFELISSAARTGCDAVKFQTYQTEKRITDKDSPLFDILKKCELPLENFKILKEFSNEQGLEFFSTPFDEESVTVLDQIGCDIFKVASFDVVNLELLRFIAALKKTVIMSVGMSNINEVKAACSILEEQSAHVTLLHCVSAYPMDPLDANLACISALKENSNCVVGYSDHTNGIEVPLYAVAAGAQVIEKHYRVDENFECIDAPVSISETQMTDFVEKVRFLEGVIGSAKVEMREAERGTSEFRRYSK